MDAQIITVTTKGQISIPVSIRKKLSMDKGDKLVAYTYGDSLILKVLKMYGFTRIITAREFCDRHL